MIDRSLQIENILISECLSRATLFAILCDVLLSDQLIILTHLLRITLFINIIKEIEIYIVEIFFFPFSAKIY